MSNPPKPLTELPLLDVFDQKSIQELVTQILASGALGRSKIYENLLRYLIDRTVSGSPPKEIEIAIDVLGRDTDFDVAKDSVVRVYIHQLRKKLDRYYEDIDVNDYANELGYRFVIPKGEYTIAATVLTALDFNESPSPTSSATIVNTGEFPKLQARRKRLRPWVIAACVLLAANLLFLSANFYLQPKNHNAVTDVAQATIWRRVLGDDIPLLIVVGDYYIFGELDEAGNVKRMVREFDINSKTDLEDLFMTEPDLAFRYYDLDLSYIPEGTAFALNHIAPILQTQSKSIELKMMSELSTQDIVSHHIVYLGYISGLDRLHDMVFAASGLRIGENYDQLVVKENGQTFTSDAGLPSFYEPFTDFGFFSLLPSTANHNIIVVAGMRDAGLIHTAQALASVEQLQQLNDYIQDSNTDANVHDDAFEALFEVRGLNRKNFEAKLVYKNFIDPSKSWMSELDSLGISSAND